MRQNGHHICRLHFQIHFLQWKYLNYDNDFTEFVPKGYYSIGSDNCWSPNSRKAIIWIINGGRASPSLDELNEKFTSLPVNLLVINKEQKKTFVKLVGPWQQLPVFDIGPVLILNIISNMGGGGGGEFLGCSETESAHLKFAVCSQAEMVKILKWQAVYYKGPFQCCTFFWQPIGLLVPVQKN